VRGETVAAGFSLRFIFYSPGLAIQEATTEALIKIEGKEITRKVTPFLKKIALVKRFKLIPQNTLDNSNILFYICN